MGACCVFVGRGKSESSSKVTHCWLGFPPGGGGWRRGARAGGMEEGGAKGKARAGAGVGAGARGSRGGGVRVDDDSKRGVVRWSWEVGGEGWAVIGAGAGTRG